MARCIDCGRRGLFMRVDADGRCASCAQIHANRMAYLAREKARIENAWSLYQALPHAEIRTDGERQKMRAVSDLDSLHFTSISAKTNAEKLGCFVVIDTETTGLAPHRDRVIELAAVRYVDFNPVEIFETLINPERPIPPEATKVNGITDDMVSGAPKIYQVLPSLSEFIADWNLVGHNLIFDLKFLYRHGLDLSDPKRKYYDTCEISKSVLKTPKYKDGELDYESDYDVDDRKLETLCEYYRIDRFAAHRALGDAHDTAELLHKLYDDKCE